MNPFCENGAHAAILMLRIKRPDLPRPFRLGGNVKFGQFELPITAILGLVGTAVIWLVVMVTQAYSRWVGLTWVAIGLVIYLVSRWRKQSLHGKVTTSQDEIISG